MKRSLWGWVLLCILSTASLVFSQTATTSLRGVIKDPSGALVPGATVTITNGANGQSFTAKADASGVYQFLQIPPAKYTITVTAAGFGDQSKTAELLVNQPANIDFALGVQAATVTVDVSATAQTLNVTDASLGNSTDNATIQALPSEERNVPDLLSLQPGVLFLPAANIGANDPRSGAVNGGRSDQGNVTIDGIDDNDQVNGYAFTGVLRQTQDSIEEFRVVTGNSNADTGRSSGAQVSMVTKSGTNKIHGAVYEYNRNGLGVANDPLVKQGQLNSGQSNVPGKLIRNIYGADLGLPLKKDKIFFFGNWEAYRRRESSPTTRTVPTASYQAGTITYFDTPNTTKSLSMGDITALDSGCKVCNTAEYPFGAGPNPNALALFNSFPAANGTASGDGLNEGSFTFASPQPVDQNTYLARMDFAPSDKHRLFVRGQLQKDTSGDVEQFPGQGPSTTFTSNNKGIIGGDVWTINTHLINDLRYGYIRQGGSASGVGKGDYVSFRFLDTPTSQSRTTVYSVPVNNLVDDLSWTKGSHTLGFGANWRLIHQNHSTDENSYSSATTNPYWLSGNAPGAGGVDGGFLNSYNIAFANMVGTVPARNDVVNYRITSVTQGSLLADGTAIQRHFSSNELEGYIQDAWRIRPNLTVTYGVRYSYLETPWETKGQQIAPTIDTHAWARQRELAAEQGQIYEQDLLFAPTGKFYNKAPYYPANKKDFAPRLAIAYSPDTKTSIRAGFGMYYDHFGEALVNDLDAHGSFGLSSSLTNPSAGVFKIEGDCANQADCSHPGAPRFMDRHTLPNIAHPTPDATTIFPYLYPNNSFSIQTGLDSRIKTPYSESMDLSVQRELPAGFIIEGSYVGRLGRRLLQSIDIAEPVNYHDPSGGGDYFTAGAALSKQADLHGGDYGGVAWYNNTGETKAPVHVPTIQWFEDVWPFMKGTDEPGESATDAIYNNEWAPYRYSYGATTSTSDIDFYCSYGCPDGWQPRMWQDQFATLYVLGSVGASYYNAGQITLRHPMSHGLQMDVAYTLSHSIDMGSDNERATLRNGGTFSFILNTWKPELNRGNSDFDTRQLVTVNGLYLLPFGRGKAVAGNANAFLDAIIGGWQWSGLARWSSGLPFSFFEPGWSTNWEIESFGVRSGPIKTHKHRDADGNIQYFDNPDAINSQVYCGGCGGGNMRLPYAGEAGERNVFRGDGYFNIDSGIAKTWKTGDFGAIRFAWEVYNVTNSVRWDPAFINTGLTGGQLGVATSVLTVPRRMQFGLRYDF
ncbi:TonB-dependent receptor [Occallatibacter riparius]|uniref:TonB-dependent receptor n=1 Tax=Occallatibacter riparius TaxID=1002689 RepID=A0A9J7BHG1_9BACT|nr:TonB-dependent receptor [Occallatibacter riparius]UWZ81953.1 TonB-dependent receptor [Occallatibacter riparius]